MIVPTLDEAATIEHTLAAALPQLGPADELLVVDGGSADDTLARVRSLDAPRLRVLTHDRPSRALQQNLGAAAAKGPWLLFLHADTRLPLGALERVRASATDWGYFALALDAGGPVMWAIQAGINRRSRAWDTPSGDQALFVQRDAFYAAGSFPDEPLLEDLLLVDRLRRRGPPTRIDVPVVTSARRWRRHGALRTVVRMWTLRAAFRLGASPQRLARHYPRR